MDNEAIKELIGRRRRQILVHSCIYYRLNNNIIKDHEYDMWSKELADLQIQYPDIAKEAPLHTEFKDFDGSTGFDLPTGDPKVLGLALQLVELHKKYLKGELG